MLDSGQNSLKTPYTIFRSLISAISSDLSKIEKKNDFWQKLANFLHKISDSKIKMSQIDDIYLLNVVFFFPNLFKYVWEEKNNV